jgi:hypothetical protein
MSASDSLSFEDDIKPMFRKRDRESMQSHFDLWSYEDVTAHSGAILAAVAAGGMPCDGAWQQAQVDRLRHWIESGMPR